jgi:hypothetical protein
MVVLSAHILLTLTSSPIRLPLQTAANMSLFATNTSTFSNVHHQTGCWISQDLLDIHTAITEGDFRKAGILIGEEVEVNRMCADNTTILLKLCQTIRKNNVIIDSHSDVQ